MFNPMQLRIGEGFDVHALVPDRALILGGVHVPHPLGLLGHSDADVLLHAITDALLGASALGDIGQHFPDTDAAYLGADSQVLLKLVGELIKREGFSIVNIDSTIHAQRPKLAPHIFGMRDNIANCLGLDISQVNVKAKTAEKMGPVGLEQSMEARAVVLLYRG
jgi:2-C-methyl-D-erythritol 2,4-cyclodiphosphate synthase